MRNGKKTLIIVLIIILLVLSLAAGFMFLYNKQQEKIAKQEEEQIVNAEQNFKNLFINLEYSKNENEAITLSYNLDKTVEGKFEVDANVPLVNIETDTAKTINDEINNIFGKKLLEVIKLNTVYSKYNVDYIAYTNNNIMSLIIKATLKEGTSAQRIMVKTYNYDLAENKIVTLEEYIERSNLDKSTIQSQIISYIREKSEATDVKLAQQYNLYIRDVRSEEYLIENIDNYYIGQDGKLYILFPYGNNNETETVDVIIVKSE